MELVIGTKRWSTWSLRPWLVLRKAGAEFTETLVEL
ncbi:MAG: glutathione S-transferase, partial [Phenylobacterium sp.]|nr:glutathione S-transferase [Phenylobacterium sp.]